MSNTHHLSRYLFTEEHTKDINNDITESLCGLDIFLRDNRAVRLVSFEPSYWYNFVVKLQEQIYCQKCFDSSEFQMWLLGYIGK